MLTVPATTMNQTLFNLPFSTETPEEAHAVRQSTTSYAELLSLLQFHATPSTRVEPIRFQHLRLRRGQRAYRIGHQLESLFVVRFGSLKVISRDDAGEEKVQAFAMKGDLLGADGIHQQAHVSEAVALSDCDLVVVPFRRFRELSRSSPELELAMYGFLSREICRERKISGMLSRLGAEARVARFLAQVAVRHAALGFSEKSFELRMTRQEIGSYLGTTLETVSRALTGLDRIGLIRVDNRNIIILDLPALAKLRRIPPSKCPLPPTAGQNDAAR
jgi:CRP/FNR family transcriptional regulator, anaerobic regulatory protein